MILDKKISYFGNIWYQSGLWQTLAGLRGPVKIIARLARKSFMPTVTCVFSIASMMFSPLITASIHSDLAGPIVNNASSTSSLQAVYLY